MAWRVKKEETIPIISTKIDEEESLEDLEEQQKELQERLKKLEVKKIEDKTSQISKQEVIDMIQGSLGRINQLVEILRRN